MILYSFKHIPETRPNFPCKAFRWTFQVCQDFIGFIHQHQLQDGQWYNSHTNVYGLWRSQRWQLGDDHFYYDGPHCFCHLGPIHLQLGGNWDCLKCLEK